MAYKDREVQRQRQREWYAANRDERLDKMRVYHQRNRDQVRTNGYVRRHGLRPEDWAALWDLQGGRCYLCGKAMIIDEASVDHDHSCCPQKESCRTCRRGLACKKCNTLIALAGEDPMRLHRIADALEMAQAAFIGRRLASGEQIALKGL